jgi:hypothetical protein
VRGQQIQDHCECARFILGAGDSGGGYGFDLLCLIHCICGGWAWVPAVVDLYLFSIYILIVNLDDVSLSKRRKTCCLPGA